VHVDRHGRIRGGNVSRDQRGSTERLNRSRATCSRRQIGSGWSATLPEGASNTCGILLRNGADSRGIRPVPHWPRSEPAHDDERTPATSVVRRAAADVAASRIARHRVRRPDLTAAVVICGRSRRVMRACAGVVDGGVTIVRRMHEARSSSRPQYARSLRWTRPPDSGIRSPPPLDRSAHVDP